jgi:hypothetical protein
MDEKKRNTYIAIAVVAALVISFLIPAENEVGRITSGHYFNVGIVKAKDRNTVTVRITEPVDSGYILVLQGKTDDFHVGQEVNIGYAYDGLFENTSQSVQVTYYKNGNLLMKFIRMFMPYFNNEWKIIDVQYDGGGIPSEPLLYYKRAERVP